MRRLLFVLAIAGCGVRTPARVDVDAILHREGPEAARIDLEAAVLAQPRDVGAHLALAALADKLERPSEAIEQLEIVGNLGGPLGIRWHDEDRERFARLIAARGQARLARGAASAVADLEQARALGAPISEADLRRANIASAIVDLRHIDAGVRERGKRELAFVVDPKLSAQAAELDRPEWRGARPNATLVERAQFGAWLWSIGAKRGAWVELSAWHDATPVPRDPVLQAAYFSAWAWWTPVDAPPPSLAELAGPERCRYGACTAAMVHDDPVAAHALFGVRTRTRDPREVISWIELGLHAALHGVDSWGAIVRAHVDVEAVVAAGYPGLPPYYRDALARFAGAPNPAGLPDAPPLDWEQAGAAGNAELPRDESADRESYLRARLVNIATLQLRGSPAAGHASFIHDSPDAALLLGLFESRPQVADPLGTAIVRAVRARIGGASVAQLAPIVAAFGRDPMVAERLGRDFVAGSVDAALAHATIGALFEALNDPARARLAWQAAVDASPEPAFLQGLAEIQARAGDPDAALVTANAAAAASGDPATSWLPIARALEDAASHPVALDAARSAIDLATADTIDAALDVAIEASRALGRDAQVAQLEARHSPRPIQEASDPTDVRAALALYRDRLSSDALARLWVASRWNPRDVASRAAIVSGTSPDDPRHAAAIAELVDLAGDRALSIEALRALR